MKIIIKETSEVKNLSIIDPKTGSDYIEALIEIEVGFNNGQFFLDKDCNQYTCDQKTFDCFKSIIDTHKKLDARIHELEKKHGTQKVFDAAWPLDITDLKEYANIVNLSLDNAFGDKE